MKRLLTALLLSALALPAAANAALRDDIAAKMDAEPYVDSWEIQGVYAGYTLVSVSTGGNGCPALFRWFHEGDEGLVMSQEFGTCAHFSETREEGDVAYIVMPSLNASQGDVLFSYDGETITDKIIGLKASGVSADDPGAWAEKSVYDYMVAGEHEAMFLRMMDWRWLDLARRSSAVGSGKMETEGNWITGSACMPHACSDNVMALGINTASGETVIAVKADGEPPRLFGQTSEPLPGPVRDLLTTP